MKRPILKKATYENLFANILSPVVSSAYLGFGSKHAI
jgi:hypothetical protein